MSEDDKVTDFLCCAACGIAEIDEIKSSQAMLETTTEPHCTEAAKNKSEDKSRKTI